MTPLDAYVSADFEAEVLWYVLLDFHIVILSKKRLNILRSRYCPPEKMYPLFKVNKTTI